MATIDQAFLQIINSKETETNLDVDPKELYRLRFAIQNGLSINAEIKIDLLSRCGWEQDLNEFTVEDLAAVLRYGQKKKAAAGN